MAQSPDHPELQFIPASGYTVGRPDGKPLWHVIHDMEASETPSCAENTANYFATGAGGRSVSSHYCADDNSVVQCVLLQNVAWTVGNRPGNNRGINWELCGFASQSTAQWLDPFGAAMFNRVVPIMRSDGIRYGIPPVRRTIAELRAFIPGVTSHNDLRLAFGGTDHTDPGANFPWAYFMALLQGAAPALEEDPDMWMTTAPSKTVYLMPGDMIAGKPVAIPMTDINRVNSLAANGVRWGVSTIEPAAAYWFVTAINAPWPPEEPPVEVVLSDEQLAQIGATTAAAAQAGAEAGAPTQAELEAAAFAGAQKAEDE